MKKLFIWLLITISIIIIYQFTADKKINYLSIGDSIMKGVNPYNIEGYGYNNYIKNYLDRNDNLQDFNNYYYNNTIDGLTKDIINNRTIIDNDHEYLFKKILRESDLVTISVGMDELAYNYDDLNMQKNYQYFELMYQDIINLIEETRRYAKNDIIFIGYYNPSPMYTSDTDEFFCYVNDKLKKLMKANDILYIDIYEEIKSGNYLNNPNNYHINVKGYLKIADLILNSYEKA